MMQAKKHAKQWYGSVTSPGAGKGSSTKLTQSQEKDVVNLGGTAPGGTTAFVGGNAQWNTPNADKAVENSPPGATVNPVQAASMYRGDHLAEEAPDGSGNVPIHPGLAPGEYRTGSDANPRSPRGMENDPTANDGRPLSPDGRHRGESPEVPKNRGAGQGKYRN
jgi:hypothetical protein